MSRTMQEKVMQEKAIQNKVNNNQINLLIDDEDAMVQLGSALAEAMGGEAVIYLQGDLGAGKTTLCRGILRHFGHQGAVKSPTYTLVEPYNVDGQLIYHFDLYRLADPEELEFIGGRDYFSEAGLCLIEWPGRGEGALPDADLEVTLDYNLPGRKATIVAGTVRGITMLARMQEGKCQ
ncbi:tRNA threonylcarbamoyladenosine biosynthesis protein TsaE [Endozoicomonas montiporae CL-33]|uniref:tRNA threonylcarbamoyladenosine biosynthesis protein TsaE n=1 Tax=Endozoicomonas montiporae CL-33 TaxID=570277 RepID=A0A142B7L6_9GAMM|nr:tRNA threonylcarbamoyladenosine biosynthesis protein TsaE [Endozoicomonas montiporae CL-33]